MLHQHGNRMFQFCKLPEPTSADAAALMVEFRWLLVSSTSYVLVGDRASRRNVREQIAQLVLLCIAKVTDLSLSTRVPWITTAHIQVLYEVLVRSRPEFQRSMNFQPPAATLRDCIYKCALASRSICVRPRHSYMRLEYEKTCAYSVRLRSLKWCSRITGLLLSSKITTVSTWHQHCYFPDASLATCRRFPNRTI